MSRPISPDALAAEYARQSARYEITRNPILRASLTDLADLIRTYDEAPQRLIFAAEPRGEAPTGE